jgi:hypothetical protein
MKFHLLLLLVGIALSGCVNIPFVDDYNYNHFECVNMRKIGNLNDIFSALKLETDAVHSRFNNPTTNAREEISVHAKNIEVIGEKIRAISSPYLTDEIYSYEAYWLLTVKNFRNKLGSYFSKGFYLYGAEVESVYYMGEKRDDMKEFIQVSPGGKPNTIFVNYHGPSSYLFMCQLKSTLVINLTVSAKNIGIRKNYQVALYIENRSEN